ncbi:hypothetical protein QTO34_006673 [Cnephaeus nilssonii]|uniref:Uncharacterized protein n=1 Tax=Cnephaeus nilssonii TaxID=3371016 RepID=A0AA40LGW7_CNENI|nr:hypothetical protein QTO34_006673 [Eptesicus nilssonii]
MISRAVYGPQGRMFPTLLQSVEAGSRAGTSLCTSADEPLQLQAHSPSFFFSHSPSPAHIKCLLVPGTMLAPGSNLEQNSSGEHTAMHIAQVLSSKNKAGVQKRLD